VKSAPIPLLFRRADLLKAQNPGYTRKDGTYVRPFNDRRAPAKVKHTKWTALALAAQQPLAPPAGAVPHPKLDENGKPKMIHRPTSPTSESTWTSAADTAVFTPGCAVPEVLNGVAITPWTDAPTGDDWDFVDGQNDDLIEQPIKLSGGKKAGAGVIIQEPDGRVWLVSPTNQYGSVMHTFPKGGVEEGLSYQASAIKEAYEESGLKVQIDAVALDVERSTSVARYYFAHRVGGSPADMGWESQAVRLVPLPQLVDYLNRPEDREIMQFLQNSGRKSL